MKDRLKKEPSNEVYNYSTNFIGTKLLVRPGRLQTIASVNAQRLGRCEFFNLLSLGMGRIQWVTIKDPKRVCKIRPSTNIVERTTVNTGVALTFAAKSYRLILTIPKSISLERRKTFLLLGGITELKSATHGMICVDLVFDSLHSGLPMRCHASPIRGSSAYPVVRRASKASPEKLPSPSFQVSQSDTFCQRQLTA